MWNGNPCGCHKPEENKKECCRKPCCWPPMEKPEEEKKECCRKPCCCPPKHEDCDRDKWPMEKPEKEHCPEKPEKECCHKPECPPKEQTHNHEVQGSVMLPAPPEEPHNHRFATVSGEAIFVGNNDHVHEVCFDTDFYENHYHEFEGRTSGAVWVGDRHVHYLKSVTEVSDGHVHEFRVATLIDNPIGE